MIFLNSVSSAESLVFYLPAGVCTHTDTEGKQSPEYFKIFGKKPTIFNEHPVPADLAKVRKITEFYGKTQLLMSLVADMKKNKIQRCKVLQEELKELWNSFRSKTHVY